MTTPTLALLVALLGTEPGPTPAFWKSWGDGQAELNGYRLIQARYGENRRGSAVLVFVTEPFSESARVKADPGKHPDADVFPVMKLNTVKDFQTGVYDYNLMMSAFAAIPPRAGMRPGALTKLSFSSQEWCGHLFDQLLFDAGGIRQQRFSYFDGEGDQERKLPNPEGGISVDELPILVRGLWTTFLGRGKTRELSILPSLERSRLAHRELQWTRGKISRDAETVEVSVPAGKLRADHWVVELPDERYEYWVEADAPFRLLRWRGPEGEEASLLGSKRMKYWELHQEGGEKALEALRLRAMTPP